MHTLYTLQPGGRAHIERRAHTDLKRPPESSNVKSKQKHGIQGCRVWFTIVLVVFVQFNGDVRPKSNENGGWDKRGRNVEVIFLFSNTSVRYSGLLFKQRALLNWDGGPEQKI